MSKRRNPSPVESPEARSALVEMYRSLLLLKEAGHFQLVSEYGCDPNAVEQCEHALQQAEFFMSPNLACTVLPAYTKVAFLTDRNRDTDEPMQGQLREGAWGLYPDRGQQALERRITMQSGFEFFVTPETVFTHFEVLERGE